MANTFNHNDKVVITDGGNVGVGTTSPTHLLHIAEASAAPIIKLERTGTSDVMLIAEGSSYGYIQNTTGPLTLGGSGGPQQVYISTSGNVGIGTTSPSYKLHVKDSTNTIVNAESGSSTYAGILQTVGSNAWRLIAQGSGASGRLDIKDESYGVTVISFPVNSGNVGIGTTSPSAKLDVNGSVNIYGDLNFTKADGIGINAKESMIFTIDSDNNDTGRVFQFMEGSGNTLMTIQEAGNVGIGTTSPNSKLEVFDGDISVTTSGSFSFLNLNRNFIPNSSGVLLGGIKYRGYSTGTTYQSGAYIYSYSSAAWTSTSSPGYLSIQTTPSGSTTPVERMVVASNGAVKLNAYGSGSNTGTATQRLAVDASGNVIEIPIGSGPVDGTGTANYITKWSDADTITNSQIFDNGTNVGIGESSPAYKLHVGGTFRASGDSSIGGNVIIGGTSAPSTTWTGVGRLAVVSDVYVGVNLTTANGTNGNDTVLALGKSRGTIASPAAVVNGETIGRLFYYGHDGTDYRYRASIESNVDGAVSSGVVPLNLKFSTGTSGANERMRITSAGNVGIGTTSPGYKLHVAGDAYVRDSLTIGSTTNIAAVAWLQFNGANVLLGEGTNTYLQANGAGSIIFRNNTPAELMRIDNGGSLYLNTYQFAYEDVSYTRLYRPNGTAGIYLGGAGDASNYYDNDYHYFRNSGGSANLGVWNSTGLGIGTTSPSAKLDIVGTNGTLAISYGNTVPNNPLHTNYYGGYTGIGMDSATAGVRIVGDTNTLVMDAGYYTSGVTQHANWNSLLRVLTNGNVGIGTTSPSEKLTISGGNVLINSNGAVIFHNTNNSSQKYYIRNGGTSLATLQFGIGNPGSDIKVTLANDGSVGIGTTSPSYKLDVAGTAGDWATRFYSNDSASAYFAHGGGYGGYIDAGSNASSGTYLLHLVSNGSSRVFVRGDGNVGIATASPNRTLTVNGVLGVASGTTDVPELVLSADGTAAYVSSTYKGTSSYVPLWFETNGSPRIAITTGGNVGIGTTSPSVKLHILGGNTDTVGQIRVGGNATEYVSGIDFYTGTSSRGFVGWRGVNSGAPYNAYGMYLLNYDNTPIIFGTATGSEKMRINDNGNVGIGTTAPGEKLEVVGTNAKIRISASAQNNIQAIELGVLNQGVEAYAKIDAVNLTNWDTNLRFYTNAASTTTQVERMRITSTGNVGIGTTSPGAKLHVDDSSADAVIRLSKGSSTIGNIDFVNEGNRFSIQDDGSRRLVIDTDGNVGIGTTSPGAKLHVSGGEIRVDAGQAVTLDTSNNMYLVGASNQLRIYNGGNPVVNITTAGNVGIGTTAPDSKFHVEDTNPEVRITGTGGTSFPRILWEYPVSATQASRWALTSSASGNTFYLYNYTQSKKVFQVDGTASHITLNHDAAGTTQIGTSTTQTAYQLYVATNVGQTGAIEAAGSVKITSGALGVNIAASATAGRIDASNDIVAYSTSDKRLKENIKPIENALDKVKSLTGVEFDWIEETKHVHGYEGHDVGVIAQEVQEVLPEAIRTNDSGYLSVRYEKMIALLVEANKELAARVELLEQKLKQ